MISITECDFNLNTERVVFVMYLLSFNYSHVIIMERNRSIPENIKLVFDEDSQVYHKNIESELTFCYLLLRSVAFLNAYQSVQ